MSRCTRLIEFFTNFTCTCNGVTGMTIPTEPDETVEVTMTATLRPEIEPGTVAWLDIQMTIPCNCNTAMVTFWVTPLDITQTIENKALEINVFPNPATDYITVEADGLQQVSIIDLQGRTILSKQADEAKPGIEISTLRCGLIYPLC